MASFDWEFDANQAKKDAQTVKEFYGERHGVLDVPDHSKPFILGQYQVHPDEQPPWISDYAEDFAEAHFPDDRVLFEKIINTRLPDDMQPRDYDQMVYEMELMVRNSPYREGVYQKPYLTHLRLQLQRPDYISSVINEKTSAVVSSFYYLLTEHIPQIPVRFLAWSFEQTPKTIDKIKYNYARLTTPKEAHILPKTAWDMVKGLDLTEKTAIVTGGSSGIGREVARSLASQGARVILPTRDVPACDQMALQWRSEFGNQSIHCASCDLMDMSSVLRFLSEMRSMNVVPDYLVNAAATLKPFLTGSHSGQANIAIGANLLSHMTLTDGVLSLMDSGAPVDPTPAEPDLMERALSKFVPGLASPSLSEGQKSRRTRRVVNLTCSEYKDAAIRGEELTAEGLGALTGVRAYNAGKLGLVAHAQHLAVWLDRTGRSDSIAINSVDPGFTYGTNLYQNTFFRRLRAEFAQRWGLKSAHDASTAAGSVLNILLNDSTANNGLHYAGLEVSESPLSFKQESWRTKFLFAIEDLRESALQTNLARSTVIRLRMADLQESMELQGRLKDMRSWYRKQSEKFERSLELPMPEMMPLGLTSLRPPPPQEFIGTKPLGIGPPDAPLIGEDLLQEWQHITDTLPVQISELERRANLTAPRPSKEEQAAIDKTQAEFDALKKQIMYERQLKSHVTSQYAEPLPAVAGASWWSWVKAKVNELTKPTINR